MPDQDVDVEDNSLRVRTLAGLRQVLDHALEHVEGLEKVVVSRAVQILLPRVEQRIGRASEQALREELQYLHDLLGGILQDSPKKKPRTAGRKGKRKGRKKPQSG